MSGDTVESIVFMFFAVCFAAFFALIAWLFVRNARAKAGNRFIEGYEFPASVKTSLVEGYPALNQGQVDKVLVGLREFFLVYNDSRVSFGKVSMPSKVVDEAWHAFILDTRAYAAFCKRAFGSFFHHIPAAAMDDSLQNLNGLKTTWATSCTRAGVSSETPDHLPILFAIDRELNIPDGFYYTADPNETDDKIYFTKRLVAKQSSSSSSGGGFSGCGGE